MGLSGSVRRIGVEPQFSLQPGVAGQDAEHGLPSLHGLAEFDQLCRDRARHRRIDSQRAPCSDLDLLLFQQRKVALQAGIRGIALAQQFVERLLQLSNATSGGNDLPLQSLHLTLPRKCVGLLLLDLQNTDITLIFKLT